MDKLVAMLTALRTLVLVLHTQEQIDTAIGALLIPLEGMIKEHEPPPAAIRLHEAYTQLREERASMLKK